MLQMMSRGNRSLPARTLQNEQGSPNVTHAHAIPICYDNDDHRPIDSEFTEAKSVGRCPSMRSAKLDELFNVIRTDNQSYAERPRQAMPATWRIAQ